METKRGLLIIFLAITFSVMIGFVLASNVGGNSNPDSNSVLYQELLCRTNFNIGILNSTISAFPNASSTLGPSITLLQYDLSKAKAMNNTGIREFVRTGYSGDMKDIINLVQSWRKNEGGYFSLDARASMIRSYEQLKATYGQCEQGVYSTIISDRVNRYKSQISDFQNKTHELSKRGFDVTQLNKLIQDAQDQIIAPLENASSANSSSVKEAVQSYCLYNGCENGTNFHLESRFQVTRINIIYEDLEKNSGVFNLSNSLLTQDGKAISNAQSALNKVGTSMYQGNQSDEVWSNIKESYNVTNQLIKQAMSFPTGRLK